MTDPQFPSDAANLLECLAEKLGGRASVSTVYGEPVTHADITIIPVARVGLGFGAGVGRIRAETAQGGGGGTSVSPVGYIEIKDGNAVFKPIRDPLVDVLVPVVSLIGAAFGPRIVRRLLRRKINAISGAGGP